MATTDAIPVPRKNIAYRVTFPIYKNANVQRILANAVRWAAPSGGLYLGQGRNIPQSLSPIAAEHVVDESLHRPK